MDKVKINYDALKNARGFEYADNKAGVSCRLVPIEEAREQDKKVNILDIIINKDVDVALLKSILHADKGLHTASYYNSYFVATYRHLLQNEFDSLKEVLL